MSIPKTNTVQVDWYDNEQTIVRYTFAPTWTWDDLFVALDVALNMERSVSHRVDVLIDATRTTELPPGLFENLKRVALQQPPNLRLSAIAISNKAIRLWMGAAAKIIPTVRRDYRVAETVEEALALIEADRTKALAS